MHERDRIGGDRADKALVDLGADDLADEGFAGEANEDRRAESPETREIPDAGVVLPRRLAEADSGIEQDAPERDAGARRQIERALEEAFDVVENVDRLVGLVAIVHDDDRRAGLGDRVRHRGIALQSPHIIDDAGAKLSRLARYSRLAGVDGDRRVDPPG